MLPAHREKTGRRKAVFLANTGFALYNFRLPLMLHMVRLGWEVVGIANDESDFSAKFKERDIEFIHLDMDHKGKNPAADIGFMQRLKAVYRRERPDLAHHFTIKPVIFGSIAARAVGVPSIVNTITGLGYAFEKKGILHSIVSKLYRYALRGRAQVIFQNSDNLDLFLSNQLVSERQCHVILGSGVDCYKLQPRGGSGGGGMTFLLVARMLWSKGIAEFVAASEALNLEFPDSTFVMAGGASGGGATGNPQMIAVDWLESVRAQGTVQWVGRVPFEEILSLMDAADVVVLPSYYPEGVPKALIEAAAKGKAIVTTNTPGCREVVEDGINGYLVPPRDASALAGAMRQLVEDPAMAKRMGRESRRRAELLFDEKIVLDRTLQVYQLAGAF